MSIQIEVHGIDASEAMVSRLRKKPGGDDIAVTVGDMADVDVDGEYSLVFVAAMLVGMGGFELLERRKPNSPIHAT